MHQSQVKRIIIQDRSCLHKAMVVEAAPAGNGGEEDQLLLESGKLLIGDAAEQEIPYHSGSLEVAHPGVNGIRRSDGAVTDAGSSVVLSFGSAAACLCGAHALARWGWRTWEFAVVRSTACAASWPPQMQLFKSAARVHCWAVRQTTQHCRGSCSSPHRDKGKSGRACNKLKHIVYAHLAMGSFCATTTGWRLLSMPCLAMQDQTFQVTSLSKSQLCAALGCHACRPLF